MRKIVIAAFLLFVGCLWAQSDPYRISSVSKAIPGQALKLVTAEAHFPHAPDKIWKLLNKFEDFPSFLPRVSSCESMGVLRDREQIYFMIDVPLGLPNLWSVVSVLRQPEDHRIQWEMLKGNMKSHEGTLKIEPEGKGSKILLEIKTDPGHFLPQRFVAWGAKKYIPKLLKAVAQKLDKMN